MKINIVIPMSGRGSRFSEAGFNDPKPLITVKSMPMIELVIRNLMPITFSYQFVFICQKEHLDSSDIERRIDDLIDNYKIIPIDYFTRGAAETVLLAREYINNDQSLMIANCDQFVDIRIDDYLNAIEKSDGAIMTMNADDPKWSFIKYEGDQIIDVVEKEVVSNDATVGIYNFSRGDFFVEAADQMIEKGLTVNGEFYVAPTYKKMIDDGMRIRTYDISGKMYGLGTPEDLREFESIETFDYLPVSI